MYDAETIANELNLPPSKERVPYDANKIILVFENDNEETRQQIHALRAYVMDCDGMSKAQQNGPAEDVYKRQIQAGMNNCWQSNSKNRSVKSRSERKNLNLSLIHIYSRLKIRLKKYPDVEIIVSRERAAELKGWLDR